MTIDEAITILTEIQVSRPLLDYYGWRDATKLGIEALKRVKRSEDPMGWGGRNLLPGETKDISST